MNNTIDAWGAPHRHYSNLHDRTNANIDIGQWTNFSSHLPPDSFDTVKRTVRLWNQKIRNQLSVETGLKLGGRQVSVRIEDGLPAPLSVLIDPNDFLTVLALNRELLEKVVRGTRYMEGVWDRVNKVHIGPAEVVEVERVRRTAEEWLRLIDDRGISHVLRDIVEDVLGAYFFHNGEIKIYWLAITIFSALWSVSLEALTFVVLAHELAHAYTHLGFDTDRQDWATHVFACTDVRIVEGLAQFYTEVVCRNLKSQIPESVDTFEVLLQHQHEVYSTHRSWVDKRERNNMEIIRGSLVECRRSGIALNPYRFAELVKRHRLEMSSGNEVASV